ncbi:MAG TPA: hypothetical protein VHW69_17920 [Rhizomicrobium sp.]|jgi:hypothetical protein|nr:hypothetical protein [Rhizomicrobium sp.]
MAARADKLLLRFRGIDNRFGVTRATLVKMAEQLGLNETQVIHYALGQLALNVLPSYSPDDGPLSARQTKMIEKLAGGPRGRSVRSSLF